MILESIHVELGPTMKTERFANCTQYPAAAIKSMTGNPNPIGSLDIVVGLVGQPKVNAPAVKMKINMFDQTRIHLVDVLYGLVVQQELLQLL